MVSEYLRKAAHNLGLTRRSITYSPDPIKGEFTVAARKTPRVGLEEALFTDFASITFPVFYAILNNGQGVVLSVNDPRVVNSVSEGEKVMVTYKQRWRIILDYVSPDFREKQVVASDLVDYKFLGLNQTNGA